MNVEVQDLWTIQEQLRYVEKINRKELKNPKDKKGIVSSPLIPFIQPQDYIFPLLHFEIGAVNNVLDSLRIFLEDQVEIISDTEKVARNRVITADVAYTRLKDSVQEAHATVAIQQLRLQKAGLSQTLRQRGLTEERIGSLVAERRQIDERIAALQAQKESLEKELGQKRKSLSDARKELKKIQSDKTKIDLPTVAGIENIFLNYSISPAAYHGGEVKWGGLQRGHGKSGTII
jgi:DNA gyrase/topoisomerase IV subunit A